MNAQAKASERQFWVVSKAGVDLGGAPKPTPKGSRAGLSGLTRISDATGTAAACDSRGKC